MVGRGTAWALAVALALTTVLLWLLIALSDVGGWAAAAIVGSFVLAFVTGVFSGGLRTVAIVAPVWVTAAAVDAIAGDSFGRTWLDSPWTSASWAATLGLLLCASAAVGGVVGWAIGLLREPAVEDEPAPPKHPSQPARARGGSAPPPPRSRPAGRAEAPRRTSAGRRPHG